MLSSDAENKEKKISFKMSKGELLGLAEYIFARLGYGL